MVFSREVAACRDEARGEVENALNDVQRDGVVGAGFADAGGKNEAKNSAARFFVRAHGIKQSCRLHAGPGGEGHEMADERDDAGNVVGAS
jgi:hypothetical protein